MTEEEIRQIAEAVVAILVERGYVRPRAVLVDAKELSRVLGLSGPGWVYANWRKLGGVRLGDGPGARYRFDVGQAIAALAGPKPPPTRSPTKRTARRSGATALIPLD